MSGILEDLGQRLDEGHIDQLASLIGADPQQTRQAIGTALPTLLGAVTRNASSSEGASQLHNALQRDHDGSLLDQLGGFFGGEATSATPAGSRTGAGEASLGHILGSRQDRVQQGVSQASGLEGSQVTKLLSMLAPMLLGAIGQRRQQGGLSAEGLGDLLKQEEQQVQTSAKSGNFVGQMLDQDGDGDFDTMDVVKFGMGKLFGK